MPFILILRRLVNVFNSGYFHDQCYLHYEILSTLKRNLLFFISQINSLNYLHSALLFGFGLEVREVAANLLK